MKPEKTSLAVNPEQECIPNLSKCIQAKSVWMDNGYHPIPSNQNQRGSKPESLRVHPISLHTSNTSKLPTELALEPHRAAVARLCGIETSTAGLKVMGCRAPRSAMPDEPKGPTRTDQPKRKKTPCNLIQPKIR